MPTLKQQARVIAGQLPQAVRTPAMSALDAGPDIPLPAVLPSLQGGNSVRLTFPSLIAGMPSTTLSVPTPKDGIRAIEGVLPAGFPRPSKLLGLTVPGEPTVGEAQDRPKTRYREVESEGGGEIRGGGYRSE